MYSFHCCKMSRGWWWCTAQGSPVDGVCWTGACRTVIRSGINEKQWGLNVSLMSHSLMTLIVTGFTTLSNCQSMASPPLTIGLLTRTDAVKQEPGEPAVKSLIADQFAQSNYSYILLMDSILPDSNAWVPPCIQRTITPRFVLRSTEQWILLVNHVKVKSPLLLINRKWDRGKD